MSFPYRDGETAHRLDPFAELSGQYIAAISKSLCSNEAFVKDSVRSWLMVQRRPRAAAAAPDPDAFQYLYGMFRSILIEDLSLHFTAKNITTTVVLSVRIFKSFTFRGTTRHLDMYSNLLAGEDREHLALLVPLFRTPTTNMTTSNTRQWSRFRFNDIFEEHWSRITFARTLVMAFLEMGIEEGRFQVAAEHIHYVMHLLYLEAPPDRLFICRAIAREAQRIMDGDYEDILSTIADGMLDDFVVHSRENHPTLFTDE